MADAVQSQKQRILFIEDEIGYQEFAQALLSSDYDLAVCATAEEAMGKIDSEHWDLIISDINMFGMTGFEVINRLKQMGKLDQCPVLLCSSQGDPATKARSAEMGAAGFVAKPFQIDLLLNMIRAFLGKPQG